MSSDGFTSPTAIVASLGSPTMNSNDQGWLAISTEGFAAMNAARPPEHLVKELMQNSLDSLPAR